MRNTLSIRLHYRLFFFFTHFRDESLYTKFFPFLLLPLLSVHSHSLTFLWFSETIFRPLIYLICFPRERQALRATVQSKFVLLHVCPPKLCDSASGMKVLMLLASYFLCVYHDSKCLCCVSYYCVPISRGREGDEKTQPCLSLFLLSDFAAT